MKKILLLLTVLCCIMMGSCSLEPDKKVDFDIVFLAADSVDVPDYVIPGNTYPIKMYYKRPTDCYYVSDGPYFETAGNTFTLAVQAYLIQDANCLPPASSESEVAEYPFQCPLTIATSYTFKIYKGDDVQGNQQFIEVQVPVQQ